MDDSIAHPKGGTAFWDVTGWKTIVSAVSAVLIGFLFVVAGVWKVTDPFSASARLIQAQVPAAISIPSAILLGIVETYAGVLLFVPRFRRWGAMLAGALLVAFAIYIGLSYDVLRGEECNCFPFIQRTVSPALFTANGVLLALVIFGGLWARPSGSRRSAILVLAAVSVFALVSYGVGAVRQGLTRAPNSITAGGKPVALDTGRAFIFFFDPECISCEEAARRISTYQWKGVKLIAVPTTQPQFAAEFLKSVGLNIPLSSDLETLRSAFSFTDPPYAVAIEEGWQKAAFTGFDTNEPAATLRRAGFIE